jgi:putative copper export protein
MELPALALRALLLACLVWAAGSLLFLALLGARSAHADRRARLLVRVAAGAGVVSLTGATALQLHAIGGDWLTTTDPFTVQLFAETSGAATALRAAGLACAMAASLQRFRVLAWPAILLLIVSFSFLGHTTSHEPEMVLRVGVVLHVGMASFWMGSLLPLAASARRDDAATAGALLARFSMLAYGAVALLLVGGAAVAVLLSQAPPWRWPETDWGRGLLVKLVGVGLLLGFAAWHRLVLTARAARGEPQASRALQRSIEAEAAVAVLVLMATAWFAYQFDPLGRS